MREIDTIHVEGDRSPWVPFSPLTEEVLLRYHRIDPVRGEVLATARFPPRRGVAPLYQTGTVIAHTIRGAWRYREHAWVARPGDTVYAGAGSVHTAEGIGEREAVVFLVVAGELLFFDDDGGLIWQESWKTSLERYTEHCLEHGLEQRDLTAPMPAPPVAPLRRTWSV